MLRILPVAEPTAAQRVRRARPCAGEGAPSCLATSKPPTRSYPLPSSTCSRAAEPRSPPRSSADSAHFHFGGFRGTDCGSTSAWCAENELHGIEPCTHEIATQAVNQSIEVGLSLDLVRPHARDHHVVGDEVTGPKA